VEARQGHRGGVVTVATGGQGGKDAWMHLTTVADGDVLELSPGQPLRFTYRPQQRESFEYVVDTAWLIDEG
jgi:cold shock CspA family protein